MQLILSSVKRGSRAAGAVTLLPEAGAGRGAQSAGRMGQQQAHRSLGMRPGTFFSQRRSYRDNKGEVPPQAREATREFCVWAHA